MIQNGVIAYFINFLVLFCLCLNFLSVLKASNDKFAYI